MTRFRSVLVLIAGALIGTLLLPSLKASPGEFVVVGSPFVPVVAGGNAGHVISCPSGWVTTGGGVALYPPENAGLRVIQSAPYVTTTAQPPGAWVGSVFNESVVDSAFTLYVICFDSPRGR